MNTYDLKQKLKVTNELINELIAKGWQETENLQTQIDNLELDSATATAAAEALTGLLTSYYIFTGRLESLLVKLEKDDLLINGLKSAPEVKKATSSSIDTKEQAVVAPVSKEVAIEDNADFEPFEYFVDFDEPIGEPLTDDDIYN